MNDTELHCGLGEHGGNSIGQTGEAVATGDEDVFDAPGVTIIN